MHRTVPRLRYGTLRQSFEIGDLFEFKMDLTSDSYRAVAFFNSSIRRHTRCGRDWSSDVCSSDLISVAGIPFNRDGHLNDGTFDVLVVKKGIFKGVLNIIRLFLLGLFGLGIKRVVKRYRASSIKVEVEGEPVWTVDGESGPVGNVEIENLHNYLQIYIPTNKKNKVKSKSFN